MRLTPSCGLPRPGWRRPAPIVARLAVLLGLLAMLGTGVTGSGTAEAPSASPFVGRQGTAFIREGTVFRPLGVNFYGAANDPATFQCGPILSDPDRQADELFRRIRAETGANVIRFWAFQAYTDGGREWRAFDRVVRLARAHGLLLLPVLENQWADCTQGGPRDAGWYAARHRQPDGGYPLAYEEYVRRVVTRYRDEPAILAWTLLNEAEAERSDGASDPAALYAFAERMTRLVKELDPNHLVTIGLIGRGQPGTEGAQYARLHALPTVDFVTYHDYGADEVPLPGARLELAGFSQRGDWTWENGPYTATVGRAWETVSHQLPADPDSGDRPRRLGLTMFGDFAGALYIDEIEVGGRVYGFEDGTSVGWSVENGAPPVATSDRAAAGSWSLRLNLDRPEEGVHLWLEPTEPLPPGATIAARVYVETPGADPPPDTLAAALATAAALDKPLLVAEAGLPTCQAPDGLPVHTPDARAARLDAKIDAFFRAGGAGYLIWVWSPKSSCAYSFSSGDPLNDVLRAWAARLASW